MSITTKADHALIALGRVHAYSTYLAKLGLIEDWKVMGFCRDIYDRRPELHVEPLESALGEALRRRQEQRDRYSSFKGP